MSSRADGRTAASQFVSLTLKLKDKLHPPRIRRPEQAKQSQQKRVDTHQEDPQCKALSELAEQQRAVVSSLQYFKALVDRVGVDKLVLNQSTIRGLLGGASSRVLEAVQTLVQLEPHPQNSSCLGRLYQSVTQLIRWADQVILQGIVQRTEEESTLSVTKVIRAVLDGAKELVRLVAEGQEDPSPVPSDQEQQTTDNSLEQDQEQQQETISAPPKPPIPLLDHPPQTLPKLVHTPPALPPKKRHSASGPTPCRVAIVAPMRREPEKSHEDEEEEAEEKDECWKRCSASSAESVAVNTLCVGNTCIEDDPDYNFLHTDLSSDDTLPPLLHRSSPPPALPEKRRCSNAAATNCDECSVSFGFDSAPQSDDPSSQCDVIGLEGSLHSPLSPSKTPPPLPEKKRHIHQYLQFCATYNAQSAAMFYPRPVTSGRQEEAETHTQLEPAPTPELPVLPPKKREQDSVHTDRQTEDSDSSEESESGQSRKEKEAQDDQQDVLLLTEQQEIHHRITIKSEGEEGPEIKAGTPDILLVFAAEADSDSGHSQYREAFATTYRSFLSPNDVIVKLQHRFRQLSNGQLELPPPAGRTFDLLLTIVDELCAMELDSDLLLLLTDMVYSLLIGGELKRAHALRSNILSKMEERWKLIGSPLSLRPLSARGVAARPGTLLDFRSQDLAEQLTLLDSELFYKIKLPEVLMWSKEQNEEKSLNLTQFTQHFNNVSFWVRSVIILQEKAQEREKLLLKFLKIMKHLRKLNNFNSYLSILSALDSAPLRRLDWQRNTSEILEEFSSLIDSSSSFRAYRAALAEVEPPCIPYLGLILQDLTFVHLGNPDSLVTPQGSKVNFSKQWQQFNILATLRSYQQVRYSLQPDEEIISFFNDFSDHLAEEALWELSLRLRPRNTPRVIQR